MKAKLLEGKLLGDRIKEELKKEIERLSSSPTLAAVQVGDNFATEIYLKAQKKTAEGLGINYRLFKLKTTASERELMGLIEELNQDSSIQGIIVQMPLPPQIERQKIIKGVSVLKDVEGMHPENLGYIILGKPRFLPCTAEAVFELVKSTNINLYGKEVVIVGHSEIVGKPLSLIFLNEFSTVTVCHIGTSEAGHLEEHVKRAEILIVAVGKAGLIKGDWIKEEAIVIDVGINKLGDKIVGDVEFAGASERASFITPVPGGVGPLTVTMLMRNLIKAAKLQQIKEDEF
ncbi:MAG: bifunctional 5,10-methylenetetrahydrofolate dehydrogenase/5,10-methenyltetrahydrofolate cyclohydrolase [Candidatus Omnitrophica bacterium]|nr:bifunctional 5,10-methylenetetrahydrofolate dehydrogenase/5,10-methenyltetrahydrofolate cyclohydrolase [Candidatus Omnitrophota bacterium]MCM8798095.1 bifunctional 5,10-methylenetetrahydrofolate dehydrogenase/5,10-methenyltetrahydrofolate cyclohydrolase [Candidatus Omnitrophota bacterium]